MRNKSFSLSIQTDFSKAKVMKNIPLKEKILRFTCFVPQHYKSSHVRHIHGKRKPKCYTIKNTSIDSSLKYPESQ